MNLTSTSRHEQVAGSLMSTSMNYYLIFILGSIPAGRVCLQVANGAEVLGGTNGSLGGPKIR